MCVGSRLWVVETQMRGSRYVYAMYGTIDVARPNVLVTDSEGRKHYDHRLYLHWMVAEVTSGAGVNTRGAHL
jgi:hypothetical protein